MKVCGLRTPADVAVALAAGADAIGIVVAPSSRQVTAERAAELVRCADGAATYLVTVDARPAELIDLAGFVGCSGVQPHGAHSAEAAAAAVSAGFAVLRPRPIADRAVLDDIPASQMPLLDTADANAHGGTGRAFDWSLAEGIDRPYVLAGGLGPGSVAAAIGRLDPWGVDASSGLESTPGVKDPDLIRAYVQEAKTP